MFSLNLMKLNICGKKIVEIMCSFLSLVKVVLAGFLYCKVTFFLL